MTYSKQMYLGGKLVDGQGTLEVFNPATEQRVGVIAAAGNEDVETALQAAKAAFPTWSKTSISERQDWMHRLRVGSCSQRGVSARLHPSRDGKIMGRHERGF